MVLISKQPQIYKSESTSSRFKTQVSNFVFGAQIIMEIRFIIKKILPFLRLFMKIATCFVTAISI